MKKIFITGISETGKTTISEELRNRGFHAISIDETKGLCSWRNRETNERVVGEVDLNKDFTDNHRWICDVEQLKELMKVEFEIIFVLGMASNQDEVSVLFDKVLILQCEPKIFIERLNTRTNNTFGKDPSIQNHMLEWYQDFENELLSKGAVSINTNRPIGEVVDEVIKQAILQ